MRQSIEPTRSLSGAPERRTRISACSGSVSWNSSTNRCVSRVRNVLRTAALSRSSVARFEQQVDEIERALCRLQLLVTFETALQVIAEMRGEIGVCARFEVAERVEQRSAARPTRPRASFRADRRRCRPCGVWQSRDCGEDPRARPRGRRSHRLVAPRCRWLRTAHGRRRGRARADPCPTTDWRTAPRTHATAAPIDRCDARARTSRGATGHRDPATSRAPSLPASAARPARPRLHQLQSSGATGGATSASRLRPVRPAVPAANGRTPRRTSRAPGLRSAPGTADRRQPRQAARASRSAQNPWIVLTRASSRCSSACLRDAPVARPLRSGAHRSSSSRSRSFSSPAAFSVKVTATICCIAAVPVRITLTMRPTSAVVLPVPAAASTMYEWSRSLAICSRSTASACSEAVIRVPSVRRRPGISRHACAWRAAPHPDRRPRRSRTTGTRPVSDTRRAVPVRSRGR